MPKPEIKRKVDQTVFPLNNCLISTFCISMMVKIPSAIPNIPDKQFTMAITKMKVWFFLSLINLAAKKFKIPTATIKSTMNPNIPVIKIKGTSGEEKSPFELCCSISLKAEAPTPKNKKNASPPRTDSMPLMM